VTSGGVSDDTGRVLGVQYGKADADTLEPADKPPPPPPPDLLWLFAYEGKSRPTHAQSVGAHGNKSGVGLGKSAKHGKFGSGPIIWPALILSVQDDLHRRPGLTEMLATCSRCGLVATTDADLLGFVDERPLPVADILRPVVGVAQAWRLGPLLVHRPRADPTCRTRVLGDGTIATPLKACGGILRPVAVTPPPWGDRTRWKPPTYDAPSVDARGCRIYWAGTVVYTREDLRHLAIHELDHRKALAGGRLAPGSPLPEWPWQSASRPIDAVRRIADLGGRAEYVVRWRRRRDPVGIRDTVTIFGKPCAAETFVRSAPHCDRIVTDYYRRCEGKVIGDWRMPSVA
jgi:hypothetical protein